MADLRRLCRDQAIGPDQIWCWPMERLGKALAWPSTCLRAVEHYRGEHGTEPNLLFLLELFCRVTIPGPVV